MKAVLISMKNSELSPEDIFSLVKLASSGSDSEKVKQELLKQMLMDKMTHEQSRQFAQLLGDQGAMESILKSEQARRLFEQLKNNK